MRYTFYFLLSRKVIKNSVPVKTCKFEMNNLKRSEILFKLIYIMFLWKYWDVKLILEYSYFLWTSHTYIVAHSGSAGGSVSTSNYICCTLASCSKHSPRAKLCSRYPILRRGWRWECWKGWSHQSILTSCRILGALLCNV